MSKSLTYPSGITDKRIFTDINNAEITLFATRIDDQVRIHRMDSGIKLEYTYASPMHVDINGAIVGFTPTWRLPQSMRNKLFSARDKKIIIRDIDDFIDYYNDINDID